MFELRKQPVQSEGKQEARVGASRWIVALALGAAACNPGTIIITTSATASETSPASETNGDSSTSVSSDITTTGPGTTSDTFTSSPSTTTESSVTSEATTEDCTFDDCDDTPKDMQCDHMNQDDCPEGEKCVPSEGGYFDKTICVPVNGDGQHGDPCTSNGPEFEDDDCDTGLVCMTDGENETKGTCVALCSGDYENPTCEPEGTICDIAAAGWLDVCRDLCDPLEPDCPDEEVCMNVGSIGPNEGTFICVNTTLPDVPTGFPCEDSKCNEGDACVAKEYYPTANCESSQNCCAQLCDLENPSCPDDIEGVECVDYTDSQYHENVGVCIVF